jgi:hypothetical protein
MGADVIEKQLENRMRAAVDGEPPLGFEPREIVARAARSRRQRRATIAAAGGAGAVLVVAASIAFATAAGGPGNSAGATGDASDTTTGSPRPVCQSPDDGEPGAEFPGSDKIVSRLRQEVPAAVHEHLEVGTKPVNHLGAHDCPPTIVAEYTTDTVIPWLRITMVHARPALDDGHDQSAQDTKLHLVRERPGEDGARIRIYQMVPDVNGTAPRPLSVVRLGADGMVTEVTESNGSRFSEQQLVALVSDARLTFPVHR